MTNEEYILQDGEKYIVTRTFDNDKYNFGKFDSLEEAIKKRDELDYEGWPLDEEFLVDDEIDEPHLDFSFKIGTSYKHGFLVLTRDETKDLIPHLPYEEECDVIFDEIKAKIKLNVLLRLSITSGNEELREHLKELSEIDPNQRANISFLLNKEDDNPLNFDEQEKLSKLEQQLEDANKEILLLKEKCNKFEKNIL
ncbi:hypothetical protein [Methanobrevibacter sp.]|uniref:hypothetical protein n=1 Tax=Methanobrevibacter sp. TaxID=66852 RepID=UPI00388F4173